MKKHWWQESVVYQIYPRSFNDSNNDGIGDIKGIIEKIDYIQKLGVDVIWLCPVYDSPNDDNGYDISDYYNIMPEFGNIEDWDFLLEECHRRGMRLIMDLVINHTSDEHPWFIESKSSKDNKYRDWYIWRKPKEGGGVPSNWGSFFGGSIWEYDEKTEEYYCHLFSKKQPDLNWANQDMKREIFTMMQWWLDKGIDGFRLDAVDFIGKNLDFPEVENPDFNGKYGSPSVHTKNRPELHTYLNEMNKEVFSKYDIMTVGEIASATPEQTLKLAGFERNELNMLFSFEHMTIDMGESGFRFDHKDWKLTDFKEIFEKWHNTLYGKAWYSTFLGNHDFPRMVSRFGNDDKYRMESAKMLAAFLLTMPGTVFIYQGDELGMTNCPFETLEEYRDVEIKNISAEMHAAGKSEMEILDIVRHKNRDNSRTPMQWNDSVNAGFSEVKPWIKVNPNYIQINAKEQENNPDSILNFYRRLISLRQENKELVYGDFKLIDRNNEDLFIYERELGNRKLLVLLNFSEKEIQYNIPLSTDYIIISEITNYKESLAAVRPYEVKIFVQEKN